MTVILAIITAVLGVGFLIFFRKPLKTLANIADRKLKPFERSALARDISLTREFVEELVREEGTNPLTPEEMLDLLFSGEGKLRLRKKDNNTSEEE